MGGQQFAAGSVHIDTTAMNRLLQADSRRGLLHIEAGATWPDIIAATRAMPPGPAGTWGIRQKQTGVDVVTLGGSISANAHGRGLLMQPIGNDIEDITVVDAYGDVHICSREENAELFSLVVGGFGLFGVIYSSTLRLAPRRRLKRLVDIIDLDDAMAAVYRRAADGCLFGDFQFAIDANDEGFLRRGVFACYKPSEADSGDAETSADLKPEDWLQLLKLAHENKRQAFQLYAQHYLSTNGNHYWSDEMQLSTYIPSYAEYLDKQSAATASSPLKETLVIGEHYVPRDRLLDFMESARIALRDFGSEVIYGTIRAISRDTVSFLPWAKGDFACVIFNLRTPHTEVGLRRTADTFRMLINIAAKLDGSFFLTYHRYASTAQVEMCYPRFREWLSLKIEHDPEELFISEWYLHYREAFATMASRE